MKKKNRKKKGNKSKNQSQTRPPMGIQQTVSKSIVLEYPPDDLYLSVFQKNVHFKFSKFIFNSQKWKQFYFQKYKNNNGGKRALRQIVQADTICCFLRGKYLTKNEPEERDCDESSEFRKHTFKQIYIPKRRVIKSIKTTKLYPNEYEYKVNSSPTQKETKIYVVNGDCLSSTVKMKGFKLNPCCLVMCSRSNPGGGYEKGAAAQEESLCRRSNLFMCLSDPYGYCGDKKSFYPHPEFGSVYVPKCLVFRDNEANGYEYFNDGVKEISFLTQYCYSDPPISSSGKIDGGKLVNKYLRKISVILSVALENSHDSIVLSAFGCGVYNNPPKHIAEMFRIVLNRKEFKNKFRVVIFSILDSKGQNLAAFSEVFQMNPIMETDFDESMI